VQIVGGVLQHHPELHGQLLDRLAFLEPPFALDQLADAADAFGATLLVPDYLQRFGTEKELRESLDGLMSGVRKLALAGAAVVAVSSVTRQRDNRGQTGYSGLGLASFRGSAELEFGADSAYLLDAGDGTTTLRCVKNRFGKPADFHLRFDGEYQRFDRGDPLDVFDAATGGKVRR
jgi:replicative DNA helicase